LLCAIKKSETDESKWGKVLSKQNLSRFVISRVKSYIM